MEKKKQLNSLLYIFLADFFALNSDELRQQSPCALALLRCSNQLGLRQIINLSFVYFLVAKQLFVKSGFILPASAIYIRKVSVHLQRLWSCFIAYTGERCFVGARRLALRGLAVKQRFVTRYNYKRYSHYLWRRDQRKWRLFMMHRRPRFFLRRYKKFRRLRYSIASLFSFRAERPYLVQRYRYIGGYFRCFSFGFLFWRALVLNKARWRVRLSTVSQYRHVRRFSQFRQRARFQARRYQTFLYRIARRQKTFFLSTSGEVGMRNSLARPLKGLVVLRCNRRALQRRRFRMRFFNRKRRLSSSILKYSRRKRVRLLSGQRLVQLRHYRLLRRARRNYRRSRRHLIRIRRRLRFYRLRRRRWLPRAWRFVKRRRRHLRSRLRLIFRKKRRKRKKRRRFIRRHRVLRRVRRRIKRRRKRRAKYSGKWHRCYIYEHRRRFRPLYKSRQARRHYYAQLVNLSRARSSFSSTFRRISPTKQGLIAIKNPSFFSLAAVCKFQVSWFNSSQKLVTPRWQLANRRIQRKYFFWSEHKVPATGRLANYTRRRQMNSFGRYRKWLNVLFIRGKRLFYYKERQQPFALMFANRSCVSTVNYRTLPQIGISIRGAFLRGLRRKRAFRHLRHSLYLVRKRRRLRILSATQVRLSRLRLRRRRRRRFVLYQTRLKRRFLVRRKDFKQRFVLKRKYRRLSYWFSKRRGLIFLARARARRRRLQANSRFQAKRFFRREINWRRDLMNVLSVTRRRRRTKRAMEWYFWRYGINRLLFRVRFLQRSNVKQNQRQRFRVAFFFRRAFRKFFINHQRGRRYRCFLHLVRRQFYSQFFKRLHAQLTEFPELKAMAATPSLRRSKALAALRANNRMRHALLAKPDAALQAFGRSRSNTRSLYRVSRYLIKRGFKQLNAHFLLTRRYPSVYDFETFNYLFDSTFFYKKFSQMGKRWRSQIIILSVLRYFRPYSSYHIIRFIKKFLVEGFPIFFEMSSLKQSNKEQPFPVPINLKFFQNYMLKALVTRFRAKRHSVSFQAALLTELWAWHVDPSQSILHDFLVNHYALGLDSRFFVHYRWRVNR